MREYTVYWNNGGRYATLVVKVPDDIPDDRVTSYVWGVIRSKGIENKVMSVHKY